MLRIKEVESCTVNSWANSVALAVRGSGAVSARHEQLIFTTNKTTFYSPYNFRGSQWPSGPSRSIWRAIRWLCLRSLGHNLIRISHPRRAPPSLPALHHRPFEAGAFRAEAPGLSLCSRSSLWSGEGLQPQLQLLLLLLLLLLLPTGLWQHRS